MAKSQPRLASRPPPLPLEVFVHGALCVAYSGQCLTSEVAGRAFGQSRRMRASLPHALRTDCRRPAGAAGRPQYLLSPQDLAGLEVLPDLVRAGVASLKIEGRLKSPEYVASITRVYRQALDRLAISRMTTESACRMRIERRSAFRVRRRRQSTATSWRWPFRAGCYTGWFRGTNNQAARPRALRQEARRVSGRSRAACERRVSCSSAARRSSPATAWCSTPAGPDEKEEGGRVYNQSRAQSAAARRSDAALRARRHRFSPRSRRATGCGRRTIPNSTGGCARLLPATRCIFSGRSNSKSTAGRPAADRRSPTTSGPRRAGRVRRAAGPGARNSRSPTDACANSSAASAARPSSSATLKNLSVAGDVMLPVSELNRLRREAVAELDRSARAAAAGT